jgi:putative FmdB family regulatory protein
MIDWPSTAVLKGRDIRKEEDGMPTYLFVCTECKKKFTLFMSISDYEKKKYNCPKCKSKKVKQQISSFQAVTSKKS